MKTYKELTNYQSCNENFSDGEYLTDQLMNSMEYYDERGWIKHMKSETNISANVLRKIWKEWKKLSGQVKRQNAYGWEKWLERFGI